jgi:hypothetical protein
MRSASGESGIENFNFTGMSVVGPPRSASDPIRNYVV